MTLGDYLFLEQMAEFFHVPVLTIYLIQTVFGVAIILIALVWLRHKNML